MRPSFFYIMVTFPRGGVLKIYWMRLQTYEMKKKIIVFLGYGRLEKTIINYARQYGNIFHHPAVSPQKVLAYSADANMGLLFYEDISLNHRYCLPNKLFDYFMAGLPVLASSQLTEVRGIVAQYNAGMSVPNNPAEIIAAVESIDTSKISRFKKNLGNLTAKYNWENQETVLLDIYQQLSRD